MSQGHDVGDSAGPCPRCGGATVVQSYDEAPWGYRGNYAWCCAKCGAFSLEKDPTKPHSEYIFQEDFAHKVGEPRKSCPCLHVNPCGVACSCAFMGMSGGCKRCASYGSPEQQKEAATRIAAAIEQYELSQLPEKVRGSESMPQSVDHLFRIHPGHVLAVCDIETVKTRADAEKAGLISFVTDQAPPECSGILVSNSFGVFDDVIAAADDAISKALQVTHVGVDMASVPDVSALTYAVVGADGSVVLMDEAMLGPSMHQCVCCVAGGDEEKKLCEYRMDTGIPTEGWWCEECYNDYRMQE